MKKASITTLGMTPEEERHRRVVKYSVAMSIRMICIVLMLFAQGWWLLVCAIGAIVLPYIAVTIANTPVRSRAVVQGPGGVMVVPSTAENAGGPDDRTYDDDRQNRETP
ncbi:DUF3099 domain-containing protein [Paramicrobacterium chengjingii]|uniref:DUF3099 domain-containing protein n=1 Tax=Paramicrobacterium chengjingii TaxID=2769067 RepID=A0ABX6YNQ6_9MICO|nr:DUF3099 domain-containing protein [Microbacterium chengjingii]QPZ39930.1 DUF3099 domain-containing protein [Microbacterium chengjingii]